jgi:hypothetical protein
MAALASARGYVFDVGLSFFRLAAWLAVGPVALGCSSSRSAGTPQCTPSACAGTSTAGECLVTLSTTTLGGDSWGSFDLILGKTTLYWAEYTNGEPYLLSVPAAGGATATLASVADSPADLLASPGLATDTSQVFWANTSGSPDGGFIESVPTSGGSPVTIASGLSYPAGMATDGTNVYFMSSSPCANVTCTGYILSVPVSGGTVSTLASNLGAGVWIFSAYGQLYWTTLDGRVLTVPTSGGTPRQLAYEVTSGVAVVADREAAYWTNSAGNVMRLPLDGGTGTVLAFGQTPGPGLAVDETSVYWVNFNTGINSADGGTAGLMKVAIDGGPVTAIPVPGQRATFQGLAIDDTSLYVLVSQYATTTVVKITPK